MDSTLDEEKGPWKPADPVPALVGIALAVSMIGGCEVSSSEPGGAERTVRAFLAARGVDERMDFLAPGFELRSAEGTLLATRDDYRAMLGWDEVAEGEMRVERTGGRGDTVTVRIEEENAFTELLGLPPFSMESRFVLADGRIVEQTLRELVEPGRPSFTALFERALEPALEWARNGAPELLAEAAPAGSVRYDGPSARALLELLRRYRSRSEARG